MSRALFPRVRALIYMKVGSRWYNYYKANSLVQITIDVDGANILSSKWAYDMWRYESTTN